MEAELRKSDVDGSNLEKAAEKCLNIAQNLSGAWLSADYNTKQRLQTLVFPDGIVYNKKKGTVRTKRTNTLFAQIEPPQRVTDENKKGNPDGDCLKYNSVPGTGIEPAHSCERQILSLLRLPIPPPGQCRKER